MTSQVDTDTLASGRGHAVLQGADVVVVVMHCLLVTGVLLRDLFKEALGLVLCVVQLGKAVGQLAPANEELETVGDEGIDVAAPGQGNTSVG